MTVTTKNPYENTSTTQLAQQESYARNLKDARINHNKKEQQQKEQHTQNIASNVNSHVSVNNKGNVIKTDAQKKSVLKRVQKKYAQKRNVKKKNSILTRRYTQAIKRYDKTPWVLMYAAVGGNIIGGLLTEVGIGYLFVIPCTLFIDVMVWKALGKKDRKEIRVLLVVSTGIKAIPIVSMLPASAYLVYLTKQKSEKRKKDAVKKMKVLNKK